MASTRVHGANGQQIPQATSRSSSLTAVSPVIRDGVDEIVTKLIEIENVIGYIESPPDAVRAPDIGELLQDASKLQGEVNDIKLAQDTKIKELRDRATNDVKKDIAKMLEGEISALIAKSVATQVEEEMEEWGNKAGVPKLVNKLKRMAEANHALLDSGTIQLDNSKSRHANSTMDVQDDFNRALRQIKCKDGRVSQLFPASLRELFSYDTTQLIQLLEDYKLHPLEKHSENLNRFLIFIGVNVSVPDQLVDFAVEEQLPAYPLQDTSRVRDERSQNLTRRRSSASDKSVNASWYGGFFG